MLDDIKNPVAIDPDDLTLGELLSFADAQPDLPLIFQYGGRCVKGGYHVTEVKAGQFAALDCGANPESWTEIFVQLWDIDEDNRTHMTSGKFARIVRKVSEHVGLDGGAKLTFEVSDGLAPMQLFRASAPQLDGQTMHVGLTPRPASCKPRDRWLDAQRQGAACCAPGLSAGQGQAGTVRTPDQS